MWSTGERNMVAIITVGRSIEIGAGALRCGDVLGHQRKCHKLSQHLTANRDDGGGGDDDDTPPIKQIGLKMTKRHGERDPT